MSTFQIVFIGLALTAGIVLGGISYFQNQAVYVLHHETKTPEEYGLTDVQEVRIQVQTGEHLRVWVRKPESDKPVLISFHGNFTRLGPSYARLKPFLDKGYGLIMFEYRGARPGDRTPGETGYAEDARLLFDQLDILMGEPIPTERRIIHGVSLGSSIAVHLAASRQAAALVLEASFDKLCKFQQNRLRGLPMCLIMWKERHDVVEHIRKIRTPLLIAHGAKDQSIPVPWARSLLNAAPEPKEFILYETGTHTNLLTQGLVEDLDQFVTAYATN